MGRTQVMGVSLRQLFGGDSDSDDVKPKRRTMKVQGTEFRKAENDPAVNDFLKQAIAEEKRLEEEGLIHY